MYYVCIVAIKTASFLSTLATFFLNDKNPETLINTMFIKASGLFNLYAYLKNSLTLSITYLTITISFPNLKLRPQSYSRKTSNRFAYCHLCIVCVLYAILNEI